jgi:uncharacterized protein YcnI
LRATSVCSALAIAGALVLAAPTGAHLTLRPPSLTTGKEMLLTIDLPNERQATMTGATLSAPSGVKLLEAPSAGGWTGVVDGNEATWSGGRIAPGAVASFTVRVRATGEPGSAAFAAEQLYDDGETVGWQTMISVLPPPGPSPSEQHLGRAVVAGLVGLALVGASLAVLHRIRRRRSLQDV